LVHSLAYGMPTGYINNFPQNGRGLGHVTRMLKKIVGTSNFLGTSNLVHSFVLGKPNGRKIIFLVKGRGLGHVTDKFSGKQSKISSKLLELATSN